MVGFIWFSILPDQDGVFEKPYKNCTKYSIIFVIRCMYVDCLVPLHMNAFQKPPYSVRFHRNPRFPRLQWYPQLCWNQEESILPSWKRAAAPFSSPGNFPALAAPAGPPAQLPMKTSSLVPLAYLPFISTTVTNYSEFWRRTVSQNLLRLNKSKLHIH